MEQRRPEACVQVGRRRPVHPRDLDVASERDGAESVLDSVVRRLHERGRKADIEAPWLHADCTGGEEMACLVDHHQEAEPDNRDQDAHAVAAVLSASRRASASASKSSLSSRAGAPSTDANVSSTVSAIPRNGSRPSRKAATATSFAALNAQG